MVPLREGGGSPLKFVEALAYGLPVVATPLAAAGLEIEAGRATISRRPPRALRSPRRSSSALDPERGNPVARAGREVAERATRSRRSRGASTSSASASTGSARSMTATRSWPACAAAAPAGR